MGLLEQLGWKRRTPQPVGHDLESGKHSEDDGSSWRRWLVRGGLFLGLVVLTVAAFPRGEVYEYTVDVGDIWRQPTLEAPFTFPIYLDQERVEARRDTVRQNTPPYFLHLPDARQRMVANRDTLQRQLNQILDAYASYRYHKQRDEAGQAREDSLRYVRLRRNALVTLSPTQWNVLAEHYAQQVQGISPSSRDEGQEPDSRLDQLLLSRAFEIGTQLLSVGVLGRSRDSVLTDEIIVRNQEEQLQRTVSKDNLYGLNEAYDYAEERLTQTFEENPEYARIAFAFFRDIFQPSLQYMRAETVEERNRRAQNVTAIQGGVEEGESIVRKGERVTTDIKRKLTSLEREMNERMGATILWKQTLGEALFALLGFAFFFFYLYLLRREVWASDRNMTLVSVVLAFIIVLFGIGVRLPSVHLYAVPVALASVLLTIIFNSRIGLFGTLILAFTGGQMLGLDLEYTLATFFAGAFGIFSVRDIKNRGQFFVSAGLVFIAYLLVLAASWLYLGTSLGRFGRELAFAAIGSSFTITASLFLWTLERAFDITTDLTLLELSDTNRPLLKELSLRAPGSFNHSLQVANLAEAAADRIGAHTLLARVGALYHDIGKMLKPEYFVENQRAGTNPHERLKPRMSALIIASHVKEGLEMGKEYNLPEQVLKFIPMHHGTARIEYFYQKALGDADEEKSPVLESEFRYPGPRPDSKESGILMLADSVEAASRSLDEPTHRRLKALIDLIFRERIDDGQLDDTDLTFRDLRLIKDTFLKMLLGIYHVRVKYPDQEEEAEDTDLVFVSVEAEDEHENVSVDYGQDDWSSEEDEQPEIERLVRVPGLRDPREPRPELAQASPHSRADQKEEQRRVAADIPKAGERKAIEGRKESAISEAAGDGLSGGEGDSSNDEVSTDRDSDSDQESPNRS